MTIEFCLSTERFNTEYAPLGVLIALYEQKGILKPLENIVTRNKKVEFSTIDKLKQVLVSILAGCETIAEVNSQLKGDEPLAQVGGWQRFADQSNLSLALDALTLMNIEELRAASSQIRKANGGTKAHDWRGFLWLDYDLSGLPCGKQAKGAKKGYFSGKKT